MKKALYNKTNTRIYFLRMSVKNAEIILCDCGYEVFSLMSWMIGNGL